MRPDELTKQILDELKSLREDVAELQEEMEEVKELLAL